MKTWRETVIDSKRRLTANKNVYILSRQELNTQHYVAQGTQSEGEIPAQTQSRVLQKL